MNRSEKIMTSPSMRTTTALCALILTSACGEDTPSTPSAADFLEFAALAMEVEAMDADITLGASTADAETKEISRSRACPAGGSISVEGEITIDGDRESGTVTVDLTATRTHDDCTFERNGGTVTVNGSGTITAHRNLVDGEPVGLQTTTNEGSNTITRDDGESRTCSFSITSVRDPEAGTLTVTGNMCGREIDRTVTWDGSAGGAGTGPGGRRGGRGGR